jgi:hypothetical protein
MGQSGASFVEGVTDVMPPQLLQALEKYGVALTGFAPSNNNDQNGDRSKAPEEAASE